MRLIITILSALCLSSAIYREPIPESVEPAPSELTLYERAVMGTPVPARLLRAVAIVESGERDDAIGPDGHDKGRMQLRELYHAERAALYGQDYNPHNPVHATRIAALILAGHFERFGDWRLALSAYNKGAGEVLQTGLAVRYLKLIDEAMEAQRCQ
jgi:soluble lytic murein transglycosylase-like protein